MKLRTLAVISFLCAVCALYLQAKFLRHAPAMPAPRTQAESRTPERLRRAPEQTFLTFPEWFLVYSPDEYADFIKDKPPSQFPFLGHVGQFWQGYETVHTATKDDYPFNGAYHIMILVIGSSTTLEYGVKWLYEAVIGRVTEWTRSEMTAEDHLAADVARQYVAFLDVEPWYRFDFLAPIKRLWTATDYNGPNQIRKWERKYILTHEYAAKAAYAWVIKQASEGSFGIEDTTTAVILDREPPLADIPELKVLQKFDDGAILANVPRYQAFTRHAQTLARHGVNFVEITGNQDVILLTAIVPENFDAARFRVIMEQPILTRPGQKRLAFTVPVPELSRALRRLSDPAIRVEHIYDY